MDQNASANSLLQSGVPNFGLPTQQFCQSPCGLSSCCSFASHFLSAENNRFSGRLAYFGKVRRRSSKETYIVYLVTVEEKMGCNAFRTSLVNPAGINGTSIIFGETDITDCNVQHVALDIFPECGSVDDILGCQIRCVRIVKEIVSVHPGTYSCYCVNYWQFTFLS